MTAVRTSNPNQVTQALQRGTNDLIRTIGAMP